MELIQFSNENNYIVLFDYQKLKDDEKFINFLSKIFSDKKIKKIGVSLQNDLQSLHQFSQNIESFYDL